MSNMYIGHGHQEHLDRATDEYKAESGDTEAMARLAEAPGAGAVTTEIFYDYVIEVPVRVTITRAEYEEAKADRDRREAHARANGLPWRGITVSRVILERATDLAVELLAPGRTQYEHAPMRIEGRGKDGQVAI